MYFFYILQCKDNSLYSGITTDVTRRFLEHKNKQGGHYTRAHGAQAIVLIEEYPNRSSASKREAEVKRMTRAQKLELLQKKPLSNSLSNPL